MFCEHRTHRLYIMHVIRGHTGWGVTLTVHLHLVPQLRMSGGISTPPICLHEAQGGKPFPFTTYSSVYWSTMLLTGHRSDTYLTLPGPRYCY
jgi:hypothetical protein